MDINTCSATTGAIRDLALYSHVIPALATLILGVFAFWRGQNRYKAGIFLAFSVVFALWFAFDLANWLLNDYNLVAATWAPLSFIELAFFLLLFAFLLVDLFGQIPVWVLWLLAISAGISFLVTITGNAVTGLNQPQCEMYDNTVLEHYKLFAESLILAATFLLGLRRIVIAWSNPSERIRVAIVTTAIFLFMGIFAGAEYYSSTTGVFEVTLYSLFALPVFVLLLTTSITSYGTFRLGDYAVKALFFVFLILAGTQFFNVQTMTDFLLAAMSFGVVLTLGIMLFRVSEREIAARHVIEIQEKELEVANTQQETLLHFISHEIKGYLTKSEAGFSEIAQGDFGVVPTGVKQLAESALREVRKGVAIVMDILDASNLKKGTISYTKKPFDMAQAAEEVVEGLQASAKEKGVALTFIKPAEPYTLEGDEDKIRRHVIRNVVDNSIKYTPAGSVTVALSRDEAEIRLTVSDTGVGITPEDMTNLFTEGGHGKDSIKINVHSTGYGLFIAKQVVEAHGGKIRAESEGKGRGARFIVEFPSA